MHGRELLSVSNDRVRKVMVIFKTHLDIGFTNLASEVINTYQNRFIPNAIKLANQLHRSGNQERFAWTTGSWLIWRYLEESSPQQRGEMIRAIENDLIYWHGLPFTTHTELADASLFELGLQIAKQLDKQFDTHTIAAKMTDVPGHTRGLISPMQRHGLNFLHIGVNPASSPPAVPPVFKWRAPNGDEINVMYQANYGQTMVLPDEETAVAISFTGDNLGPQSPAQIRKTYHDLKRQFKRAEIVTASLNDLAQEIEKTANSIPVVTEELGDTWIHGAASDPLKMAQFRRLSALRRDWILNRELEQFGQIDLEFGTKLLQVAEHTWGLDVKTHLKDWHIYNRDDFNEARKKENFKRIEYSWQEKRNYIPEAIRLLPPNLENQAQKALLELSPSLPDHSAYVSIQPKSGIIDSGRFTIGFDDKSGALNHLFDKQTRREWATEKQQIGQLVYETFDQSDYDRFFEQYFTSKSDWAFRDFGKTGLDQSDAVSMRMILQCTGLKQLKMKDTHHFLVQYNYTDPKSFALPGKLIVHWRIPNESNEIKFDLHCFDKPANRKPEAIWLGIHPNHQNNGQLILDKMDHPVEYRDVRKNGNRDLHGVQSGLHYLDPDNGYKLVMNEAFLVAPGAPSLLNYTNHLPDVKSGYHINLYNNVWGTNFSMWFEDDMKYSFIFEF